MLKEWICKKCGKVEYLKYKAFWYREHIGTGMCRSCSNIGKKGGFAKGFTPWNKGKHWDKEMKTKMSNIRKKRFETEDAWNKGLKGFLAGKKHYRWIEDRSKLAKKQERNDSAYREWRLNVYKRDNYKCRICNEDCSGRIIAHHILGWSKYPELRYDVNNGITLCQAHHPLKRAEEKRLTPYFEELVSVLKV